MDVPAWMLGKHELDDELLEATARARVTAQVEYRPSCIEQVIGVSRGIRA